MKKLLAVSLVIACILFSGCINGSEEDNVKDVVRDYYSAYNSRDAEAVVGLFSSTVSGSGEEFDTFVANLENVMTAADESNLELKIMRFLNVRIIDDEAAVNFDVQLTDDEREIYSNVTFELVKEEGKWKILEMVEEQ